MGLTVPQVQLFPSGELGILSYSLSVIQMIIITNDMTKQ